PDLRPAEEEALLGREVVNAGRSRLALERLLEGVVGDREAAEVCDRLAADELARLVQARLDLEGVELLDDAVRAVFKVLHVGGRPPVLEVAGEVELRSLVVEAVRDLVADDRADAAVVDGVVCRGVEEGRLQYPG